MQDTDYAELFQNERKKNMNTIKGNTKQEITTAKQISNHIGETIQIHGSIYKIRKMKDFSFVLLRMRRDIVQCVYTGARGVLATVEREVELRESGKSSELSSNYIAK